MTRVNRLLLVLMPIQFADNLYLTSSMLGAGLSSFAELVLKRCGVPMRPAQVSATSGSRMSDREIMCPKQSFIRVGALYPIPRCRKNSSTHGLPPACTGNLRANRLALIR